MVSPISFSAARSWRSRWRQVSISSANCASLIARPGAIGRMRRASSSKSQMNSRPVPSFVKLRPSFGENRDARAEEGAAHGRDQGHAVHQVEDLGRVGLAGAGPVAAQQRIAAPGGAPGGEILRAADLRRVVDAAAREGRARIFRLEPVDERLDAVDVLVAEVVLLAELRGHIDMGDVVAGGRINAVQRFEEDPIAAEPFGDLGDVGAVQPVKL